MSPQCPNSDLFSQLRSEFPIFGTHPELVYLDSAATAQKPRCVLDAERRFYEEHNANVHRGSYALAIAATDAFENARSSIAGLLGVASDELIFTRGCTEGINLVAHSWGDSLAAGDEILVSTLEHHANIVPWQLLAQRRGVVIRPIPLNAAGQIDLPAYQALLGPRTRLVAITQAANATGTLPPLAEMIAAAHAAGALVLVDGAQGVVHRADGPAALAADFYAFSGHKVYGPTGIGVLYARRELLANLPPWQGGGEMIERVSFAGSSFAPAPQRFEAGTPPIAQAIGLATAMRWLAALDAADLHAHETGLQHRLETGLLDLPGVQVLAAATPRAPITALHFAGAHAYDVAHCLDARQIAVRVGQHCAHPLLAHFGVSSSLRVSLAAYNTTDDIDRFLVALGEALELLA
ncbi:aminotransferase class V-fold PLP-dependent enzyme [Chitinilyticum litopenaei]|uniref:aminotransferase class V-fold PLP-dependent enzyme n=1 Tax=Chitinilyticum litopenaei TaxID=1121276 RepID=UPI00048F430F|nr:SufS family cysteine desulfurase [Chitinilyticum litopenaei]